VSVSCCYMATGGPGSCQNALHTVQGSGMDNCVARGRQKGDMRVLWCTQLQEQAAGGCAAYRKGNACTHTAKILLDALRLFVFPNTRFPVALNVAGDLASTSSLRLAVFDPRRRVVQM